MGKRFVKRLLQTAGIFLVLLSCAVLVGPLLRLLRRHSPDPLTRLLELVDEKAWLNDWIEAAPLYQKVEELCIQRNDLSCALYAREPDSSPFQKPEAFQLRSRSCRRDLTLGAARDYRARLRVLSVRGMLEVNYDAAMTSATYSEIEKMALRRGHFLIASQGKR
jgi:hypothetical protein